MFSQVVLDYFQVLYMAKGREWRDFNLFDLLLFVFDKLTGSCLNVHLHLQK